MSNQKQNLLTLDQSSRGLVLRFGREWVLPHWRRLILCFFFMAIFAATAPAYPFLIQYANGLLEQEDQAVIYLVPILILAVTSIKGIAFYIQSVLTNAITLRIIADLQKKMFGHLLHSDFARLARDPTGTLISRFTNDTNVIRDATSRAMTGLVRDVLTVVGLIGYLFYLDWMLSLIVLVIYPLAALPIVEIGRRLRKGSKNTQQEMGDMTSLLYESFSGTRMVKTYGLEAYEQNRADRRFDGLYQILMKMARSRSALDPFLEVLGGVAVGGVIAFLGYRAAVSGDGSGIDSVGDFAAFITALLLAAQPVRAIGTLNGVLQEGLAAAQRVYELLDEKPAIIDAPDARPLKAGSGSVSFKGVSFAYEKGINALEEFSIEVAPGQKVALVGPSGAGKSTVLNLIPRLFDVTTGTVLVDEQDVRKVTMNSLREQMALVSQDVVLFNDTVRANIALGRLEATNEEIEAAAKAAAAHDFIMALPDGYDTKVGDRGTKLSGGERQRISLARAILRDANILLLDEATSALDAESERRVQEALDRLTENRTAIIIAHRLSTVRNADIIYVMDKGRVCESGTHEDLTAQDGLYAKLCRLQFFASEEADLPDEKTEASV